MKHVCILVLAFLAVALLGTVNSSATPSQTINIRGQLLDTNGHAMAGVRAYHIQFYDAPSGGSMIGLPSTGTTPVSAEGLFNIEAELPSGALLVTQLWYEVAVSSSAAPAPLGPNDLFPNRVKVNSVPFALESATVNHVEVSAIGSGGISDTEFGYLTGLTSNIQIQLNSKADTSAVYTKTEADASLNTKANTSDVYTKSDINTALSAKADAANVYTKTESDALLDAKANASDVYTKTQVDDSQNTQDTNIAAKVTKTGDTMTGMLTISSAPLVVSNSYVNIGQSTAPSTPVDKLYNVNGNLAWNGNRVYQFTWNAVTANTSMVRNNGYLVNSSSTVTLTLPTSSSLSVGDTVRVNGLGTGIWGNHPKRVAIHYNGIVADTGIFWRLDRTG